jgi:AraC family transcriptional regulator, regulatory protein of adaptative response / methylated-DNA-[protein]-cysteine methyltransferase
MEPVVYRYIETPVGKMIAGATSRGVSLFEFADRGGMDAITKRILKRHKRGMIEGSHPLIDQVEKEISEYFSGQRKIFTVPLETGGTSFERRVWEYLLTIPYGSTCSYGEIATSFGKPGASRAVGRANGANYIAIIIPCHRVIEADGNLRGYGGGLWRKRFLLRLEADHSEGPGLFSS